MLRLPGYSFKRVGLVGLGSSKSSSTSAPYKGLEEIIALVAKAVHASNAAVVLASAISEEFKLNAASAIALGTLLGVFEDNRFKSEAKINSAGVMISIFKLIMAFEYNNLSFDHENTFQFSCDQTRQFDCGSQYAASAHRHIPEKRHFPDMPPTQDDNCLSNEEYLRTENNSKRSIGDDDENFQTDAKRKRQAEYIENFDDMSHVDPLIHHISFFPGYCEDFHQSVQSSQLEESNSYILECLPRKLVSIGTNHQEEIPELQSNLESTDEEINNDKWLGNYIDSISNLTYPNIIDCQCLDKSSITCVRQHVIEAREQLKNIYGYKRFVKLGLSEIGEQVVLNWTEEEEKLFNEVVMSNPISAGRNFLGWKKYSEVMLGIPLLEGTNPALCFPGYVVGYEAVCYTNIYSEVLAADVYASKFEYFLLNQNAGLQFRKKVLAPGGAKDPNEIIRDYLGREPYVRSFIDSNTRNSLWNTLIYNAC